MYRFVFALLVALAVADQVRAQSCYGGPPAAYAYGNGGLAYRPNGNGAAYGFAPAPYANGNGHHRPRVLEYIGRDGTYLRLELGGGGPGYLAPPNVMETYSPPRQPVYYAPPPAYAPAPQYAERRLGVELTRRRAVCPTCPQ